MPQVGVPPKGGDQRLSYVFHHADFIIVAVLNQLGYVLFKLRPCVYQVITEKVVNRDANGVGYADNGRQAGLCRAGFNVADVGRG